MDFLSYPFIRAYPFIREIRVGQKNVKHFVGFFEYGINWPLTAASLGSKILRFSVFFLKFSIFYNISHKFAVWRKAVWRWQKLGLQQNDYRQWKYWQRYVWTLYFIRQCFALDLSYVYKKKEQRKTLTDINLFRDYDQKWMSLLGFSTILRPFLVIFSPTKGRLISKGLFGILNSSNKWTKKFRLTTMIPQVELFAFFFWRNWRHQKRHFEINWPLKVSKFGGRLMKLWAYSRLF